MIDTVKYKIEADERFIAKLRRKAVEFSAVDHANEEKEVFRFFKMDERLGSFEYRPIIRLTDYNYFFIELSIPKYLFGHNIYLFAPEMLEKALQKLHADLSKAFECEFPAVIFWSLYRLDLCYAWKFYDDLVAQQVLEALKLQTYARKKRSTWDTSVMFQGSAFTLKFYHKGAEFFAHDWKEIKKKDIDRANGLLNVARGVIRFEITLRHEQIMSIFNIPKDSLNITTQLTRDTILSILRGEMKKLLKLDCEVTPLSEAYAKIFASYRPTPAAKLFAFYRMFTSSDPYDRASVMGLPRSTRSRSLAKVRHLRLGVPAYVPNSPTSLAIPSEYSVGEFQPRSNTGVASHFWDT